MYQELQTLLGFEDVPVQFHPVLVFVTALCFFLILAFILDVCKNLILRR